MSYFESVREVFMLLDGDVIEQQYEITFDCYIYYVNEPAVIDRLPENCQPASVELITQLKTLIEVIDLGTEKTIKNEETLKNIEKQLNGELDNNDEVKQNILEQVIG